MLYSSVFAGEQQEGRPEGALLEIDHDMHLCSDPGIDRSNEGFNGRLLELALWDEALDPETVLNFYQQAWLLDKRLGLLPNQIFILPNISLKRKQQIWHLKFWLEGGWMLWTSLPWHSEFAYLQHIAEEIAPSTSGLEAPSPAFSNFIETQEGDFVSTKNVNSKTCL